MEYRQQKHWNRFSKDYWVAESDWFYQSDLLLLIHYYLFTRLLYNLFLCFELKVRDANTIFKDKTI